MLTVKINETLHELLIEPLALQILRLLLTTKDLSFDATVRCTDPNIGPGFARSPALCAVLVAKPLRIGTDKCNIRARHHPAVPSMQCLWYF